MNPEQFQRFQQHLHRQMHLAVRTTIDHGTPVHREEVIAAALRFCLNHLQLLIDQKRKDPSRRTH